MFNAITGVYSPSQGSIRFEGSELARPLTWLVRLTCVLVGLVTGFATMLLAVDANLLWRATIRRNMRVENEPFTWSEASEDLFSYFLGELAVEPGFRGRWLVVSPHLNRELGEAVTRELAVELLREIKRTIAAEGRIAAIADEVRWRVSVDQDEISEIRAASNWVPRAAWIGFAIGFSTGATGAFAVWQRSRRTPEVVARGGLARTFQNIRLFREMSILENVLVGIDTARLSGRKRPMRKSHQHGDWPTTLREAEGLLQFVGIKAPVATGDPN